MAHDVFISYSSKDKKAAESVCAKLESEGIKCWIAPRDIPPSARYAQSIINGISASRLMIFIFSSNANDSEHVESEIDRAYNKRIPIIPLRIEDITLTGSLEYYLSTAQWFDALPPIEEHLEKLPAVVRQLIESRTNVEPSAPREQMPAKLQATPEKQNFFSSTAFKIIAGLVLAGIIAIVAFLWFMPPMKMEVHEDKGENKNASTNGKPNAPTKSSTITSTNEVIIDARNKLMWTKYPADADVNWDEAVKYCEELSLNGFNDWRLPSYLDLKATNDSDIPEAERAWTSIDFDEPCCYWTATEEKDKKRARVFNEKLDVQSLSKETKDDMNALCVHHSGK
ncbi:MAG: TIR domain-containing protein [Pyrinomonadaceae bacterium]